MIFVQDRFAELFATAAAQMRTTPPRAVRLGAEYETLLRRGDPAQQHRCHRPRTSSTSSTQRHTGMPKGVMLSHGALARSAQTIAAASRASPATGS